MNQHLQTILSFIQQSEHLSEEEKTALSKAAKDADKELEITSFKLDHTEKVNHTTAILLEETIEELEQKRKSVEAQNRELEIEASLERVRAIALSIKEPADMLEVCTIIAKELDKLSLKEIRNVQTAIFYEEKGTYMNYEYYARHNKTVITETSYTNHTMHQAFANQMLKGKGEFFSTHLSKAELPDWIAYQKTTNVFIDNFIQSAASLDYYWFSLGAVALGISTYLPLSEEEINLFKRFRNVFELAYRRYLDIEKAEAQAREAQIEVALERVRAKTMAMHTSEQLAETAKIFFEQFNLLGKIPDRMSIGIINEESKKVELWVTDQSGNPLNQEYFFSIDERTSIAKIYSAWKERKDTIIIDLTGQDLQDWLQFVREEAGLAVDETKIKGRRVQQAAFFSRGFLLFTTHEPVAGEIMKLLVRFAKVFDQTYTRFLDLQKAEAQAKGAQIEAALERVRAQTMAMNKSHDLQQVVSIIFRELDKLELKTLRCGIGIIDEENRCVSVWTTTTTKDGYEVSFSGNESLDIHPMLQAVFKAWEKQEDYYHVLTGDDLISYYNTQKEDNYKLPDTVAGVVISKSDCQYYFCSVFPAGGLFSFQEIPFTEELINIIRRFANAFGLAYKRFEDLKQSEARALEAIRESSLDRVRAEIASMRTTDDLQRITPLIWRELTVLGVPFFRCGVFIMDEMNVEVRVYLSAPDGHSLGAMNLPFNANALTAHAVENWHKGQVYTEHWDKEAFTSWMQTMIEQGQIQDKETYQGGAATAPESLDLHLVPFTQGMLYVGNDKPLQKDKIDLIKSLAEAFSIAYARYEDFNKLELAKEQIEKTLVDLKQTQAQLIQSEKMASLGELTAGIAHEIQNPLNFVNNFSEVNRELIEELKSEKSKVRSERDEQLEVDILNDIAANEEKINHHGKRAGAIVKGMLQHSRKSEGVKEPTDINALCDEYLRLSYHGLRAKDKSFNAGFKTDFDADLSSVEGKINIVPQDIGRVLLNLINNAFYAVSKPPSPKGEQYKPLVIVTTRKIKPENNNTAKNTPPAGGDGGIEIRVEDNGSGIPQNIVDKIFQPFFTTKPTGEGTGLGLSLSYDIIKAHGGEIKVETKEGEGTTFIIQLPV